RSARGPNPSSQPYGPHSRARWLPTGSASAGSTLPGMAGDPAGASGLVGPRGQVEKRWGWGIDGNARVRPVPLYGAFTCGWQTVSEPMGAEGVDDEFAESKVGQDVNYFTDSLK